MKLLKFGKGNKKLSKNIYTFALPSGWTCPFADKCLSKADVNTATGKRHIIDGPNTEFRCFSATQEAVYKNVFDARWHNFKLLKEAKTSAKMSGIILDSLPEGAGIVRIHVAGDFFNQDYFDAWLRVAELRPDTTFYAYTKSLKYWVARLDKIPSNMMLNASRGGKYDELIDMYNLKSAKVVFSEDEAEQLGLEIDHDDSHAYDGDESFALLLHGTQPKGSKAAEALKKIKAKKNGQSKMAKAA